MSGNETLKQRMNNLINMRSLKEGDRDEEEIDQYIKNSDDLLEDSSLARSNLGRFTLAYEGIHCIALAVLNHFGARPGDGDGHRTVALQFAADALELAKKHPDSLRVMMHIHDTRNKKIYRQPIPPVSKTVADTAVNMLRGMIPLTRTLVKSDIEDTNESASAPKM